MPAQLPCLRLLARLKWHDLVTSRIRRKLAKQARWRLPLLMVLPRNGEIAEVGVWKGRFSKLLCEVTWPRRLLLVDPWSDKAVELPWQGRSKDFVNAADIFEDAYQQVRNAFASDPRIEIIRAPSLEAAHNVPDGSLDAVYIDGSHEYEDVAADLRAWAPKLRPGGLLTGDDFHYTLDKQTFPVRRAAEEFVSDTRPSRWAQFRGQFIIIPR